MIPLKVLINRKLFWLIKVFIEPFHKFAFETIKIILMIALLLSFFDVNYDNELALKIKYSLLRKYFFWLKDVTMLR